MFARKRILKLVPLEVIQGPNLETSESLTLAKLVVVRHALLRRGGRRR